MKEFLSTLLGKDIEIIEARKPPCEVGKMHPKFQSYVEKVIANLSKPQIDFLKKDDDSLEAGAGVSTWMILRDKGIVDNDFTLTNFGYTLRNYLLKDYKI
jgi:hypothetical protein